MPIHLDDLLGTPQGNIDLHHRPIVHNADGSISTVRSKSFNLDGREVLLPTISEDGRNLSDAETVDLYKKSEKNLGIFNTPEEATAYAKRLHEQQASEYLPQSKTPPPSTTLDDVLDYVGAAGKGLLHAVGVPTSVPRTPGELLDATSIFVPNIYGYLHQGYEMAQHEIAAVRGVRDAPTLPRKIQAGVTGVPMIGDPLAAVAEPGIEYGEGTAPTHQANVGAVEGGVNLAALLVAPKVIKAAGKRFGTEGAPPEQPGLTQDKAVVPQTEVPTPSAEGVHLDDLLSAPEAETPIRPPEETSGPVAAVHLDDLLTDRAEPAEQVPFDVEGEDARRQQHVDKLKEFDQRIQAAMDQGGKGLANILDEQERWRSGSENGPENVTSSELPPGMDIHVDDLLGDDGDIVSEGPAPGKSFVVPKYPWAQNIKIPVREAPALTPPSEPVQPSAPSDGNNLNSNWLDDFPEAEQAPPTPETPMPPELGEELPQELTSEPKPTSPEAVRNMIGTDADTELANAKTTRKTFFEKGSAMLRNPSQIFNALLVPGDDVLLKSGPAGQEAVRTTRPIELVRAQAVGKADALYHDMTAGMTSAEKGGMGLLLDGQLDANSPNVTPRMRAAAAEARKFFDDYLARAQDAGTGVEAKQGFFPHFRETPIHDVEKPLPEFQKFGMESPSFHYHQVDDRPGYSLDLGYVMRRYAYNAESELQAIRAFGAADAETISNKISEWGDAIAKQGGDGVLAKKILLEKFNMESPELPSMRKGSRDIAATIGAMNTLTTPIRHIGKYVNSLSQIGFRGAGKGLAKIAEAMVNPEARQQIRASGVSLRNSMDLVIPNTKENAFYRITRVLPWIKATKALDAGGRVMTYFGADPWIDETVRVARGDKTYLGSLTEGMRKRAAEDAFNRAHNIFGISEQSIESGDLTPREREYARLAASDVTEFNPERGQLPYAATVGAAGRLFYNLRKFATSQANFMYNNVVKPASYGNVKPMARFLAGSALAGAVAEPLLHMVNRQPDAVLNYFGVPLRPEGNQTWEDWRKNAMAVGALHNLGLIYLMVEGRDVLQAVPMASAGLLGRGLHGAVSDFVNAGRVSIGHPNAKDKVQEDLPQWWDEARTNLKDLDGKNVKDVARSTQMTWLMRKWYREARGLQDQ